MHHQLRNVLEGHGRQLRRFAFATDADHHSSLNSKSMAKLYDGKDYITCRVQADYQDPQQ